MARLFDFQAASINELMAGKHFIVAGCGAGKTAMAVVWANNKCVDTGKRNILVVTTASKSRTGDFEEEADLWCPSLRNSLSSFSVLSWHKLRAWVETNWGSLGDYVYIFDEVQRAKAGMAIVLPVFTGVWLCKKQDKVLK